MAYLNLSHPVAANPDAVTALMEADYIIAGPGDLYTSTLANIIIPGIAEAIVKSKAVFIFVSNLMTKIGQTHGFTASNHVSEITKYVGRNPDIVIVHRGGFDARILK
jgi:uncharacterized cofD-like protein